MAPPPRPPLSMRLLPRHWVMLDGCVALAYGLLAWALFGHGADAVALVVTGAVLASLSIWSARRHPVPAFLAVLGTLLLSAAAPTLAWLALAPMGYALFQVASRCSLRRSLPILAGSMFGAVATALPRWQHTGAVIPFGLAFATSWVAGYAVGQRRTYGEELVRHHAELAEAERARAGHAVTEERLRIARELHDVVAHSMSVITVQAGYGYLVGDDQPAEARKALGAIEVTGRQTLVEMRRLLGVVRSDDPAPSGSSPAPALEPTPGLDDLDQLIARIAQAGVTVELTVTGDSRRLPPGVELSAYRIVQEALTNVVKHAGATTARTTIHYRPDELVVDVIDRGNGHPVAVTPGIGHGLIGMRERAGLCHGTLDAGPCPRGGYRVIARLPLAGART